MAQTKLAMESHKGRTTLWDAGIWEDAMSVVSINWYMTIPLFVKIKLYYLVHSKISSNPKCSFLGWNET